jgi:predicted nucleotidyltransferase
MDWMTEAAAMVREIVPGARVWAFGSRVKGTERDGSDLDLLIDAGRPLTLDERAALSVRFEESGLPMRVDFVDAQQADPQFLQAIVSERIPLWGK